MLNEGWDVLNLFDIVRLYNTRDGKWVRGKYKPGNTTIGEAQLIGRGARYFPFQLDETHQVAIDVTSLPSGRELISYIVCEDMKRARLTCEFSR